MKNLLKISLILFTFIALYSCKKDDDDEVVVIACDEWFEGDPCVEMRIKFAGDYVGGAGFCGKNYEYEVTLTPNVVNGITVGIANPGDPIVYTFDALLTSATDFNIPEQEITIGGSVAGSVRGDGNLDDNTLSYHLVVIGQGECDHVATKI